MEKTTRKVEYFFNNIWNEDLPLELVKTFDHPISRITHISGHVWQQTYYYGKVRHRLDGPAYFYRNTSTLEVQKFWHVYGRYLPDFELYYKENNVSESLFRYLKDYPRYTKEIIPLAEHWLTEDQVLLLKSLSLFQ